MCLFTLVFEWWEKALHIPQVGPLSPVTTYWLKSSGDCKTPSWDPKICWVIRNQQHFACSKVIFHIFTALYFCGWPCVCRGPFVFQQQYHSRHRCNWNCWGNVGSQRVFWHWILNYGRILGKCCRSVLCLFSLCTFWNPLGYVDQGHYLKWSWLSFVNYCLDQKLQLFAPVLRHMLV